MFQFSPELEKVLRQAGWTPTRSVDVVRWVDPLVREGYTPGPVAKGILQNLGGLVIDPPKNKTNLFFPGQIKFDPFRAASGELDRVNQWQKENGLTLFPLGEYEPCFILLCTEGGKIFGGRENIFALLGNTIEEALELRVFARTRPILYSKQ